MKTKQLLYLWRSPPWCDWQHFGMCYKSVTNLGPWVLRYSHWDSCLSIFTGRHSEVHLPENYYEKRQNLIHVWDHRVMGKFRLEKTLSSKEGVLWGFLGKFAVSSEPHVFSDIYSPLKTDHRYPLSPETEELDKSALELDMLVFLMDFT